MKQAIKKVKATLKKADVHLMSDKEKAYSAKMLTASSKEKLAKVLLAKAKVSNWEAQTELGHVITDKQRVDAEAKAAKAKGVLFKAKAKNEGFVDLMKRTAHGLARYKEGLNKAKKKVKKVKKTNAKADLKRKLATLKSETAVATTSAPAPAKPVAGVRRRRSAPKGAKDA